MNKSMIAVVTGLLILIGIGLALLLPKEPMEDTPAASPPSPQTTQTIPVDEGKQSASAEEVAIDIKGFAFAQKELTIKKGTKVTWTNQDSAKHDIVSDEGAPAGGPAGPLLAKGESYSFTFNTVGRFGYHCSPHPNMKATVIVTE